jgi:hypothetical protein
VALGSWGPETSRTQGHSQPNRELLDAAALCRQLVPDGSVEAFLADHRQELYPDELFSDLCDDQVEFEFGLDLLLDGLEGLHTT